MSILNLNGPTGRPARSKRAVKVWMGIGMVIAVLGVGSTLASTITINSDNNTEFGQGVQRTVYCGGDQEITVKPISTYVESSTARSLEDERNDDARATSAPGYFYLSGISVSDIPDNCSGVNFVLSVYEVGGTEPVLISSLGGIQVKTPTVLWKRLENGQDSGILSLSRNLWTDPGYAASLSVGAQSLGSGSFTVTFNGAEQTTDINNVGRILIETQDDVFDGDGNSFVVSGARIR